MTLAPGDRLGPYEVVALIGAGGMGEVYRARDTRLNRVVAIKVLLPHVAAQPDLRRRFEREARAVSSLNHPHICRLYDIGEQDGMDYLVMEYLEGDTLGRSLEAGPLALDEMLRCGIQIADALSHAHQQGIFHRDLKPGNVILTRSGAKLLDFGLAKLKFPEGSGTLPTLAPEAPTLTVEGSIAGTLQYMAPEQLQGRPVDGRTDIFSFGALLFEMATGRRAFDADSAASLIASILSSEPPPPSSLAATVAQAAQSRALDRVIRRCLAKKPENRWQTAQDLTSELEWIAESSWHAAAATGAAPAPAPAPEPPRRWRERLAWTSAALTAAAALALVVFRPSAQRLEPPAVRFHLAAPEKTTLSGSIAVSPDGKHLALVAASADGSNALWVRRLDSVEARLLPSTEGAAHPFWSPDSRFLAFFAGGKLKKIRLDGGPPQVLCDVFEARGGTWSRDGVIVFSPNDRDPLYRIAETGGAPAPVTSFDRSRQESSHQWPHFLPDGRRFLYLVWSAKPEARGIYVGSLDGKQNQRLLASDWGVVFARRDQQDRLLFLRDNTLLAQAFDPQSLRLSGEPLPVAEQVWHDSTVPGLASFSASGNGVLAFRSGGARGTQLTWYDRAGKPLGTVGQPGAYRDPALSPDEKRVVVPKLDPQTGTLDLWLFETSRDISSRLTFHPLNEGTPLWSPDAARILYYSDRDGPANLYQKSSSGAGEETAVLESPVSKFPTGWGRDRVVFANWGDRTKWDLWVLEVAPAPKPTPYLQTEFDSFQAVFSADGRWVAYASNETNRYEVYVQPYPISSGKWQVSTAGGAQPSWRRDGRELYYLAPDRRLMAVDLKAGPGFDPGVPKPLFQTRVTDLANSRNQYTPSADGQRFLVNTVVGETTAWPITVALNWDTTLEARQ